MIQLRSPAGTPAEHPCSPLNQPGWLRSRFGSYYSCGGETLVAKLTRRQFLKRAGVAVAGLALLGPGCGQMSAESTEEPEVPTATRPVRQEVPTAAHIIQPEVPAATHTIQQETPTATRQAAYLSVARGADPEAITKAAIAALGGMERFVKAGDDVIVKPNICAGYHGPEYAVTTNPTVVATLVRLCLGAGARRVRVMDTPFGGTAESAYAVSGIGEAVKAAGGQMEVMSPVKFVSTDFPDARTFSSWEVYQDVLDADVLINVPIAKTHARSRLTLGGKNLMGLILRPGDMHRDLGQRIADLMTLVRPTLTVVDAVRILTANGPTGGNLDDVKQTETVLASQDTVAADAWAATLFNMSGADIPYIQAAVERGLGILDLDAIKVEEISV